MKEETKYKRIPSQLQDISTQYKTESIGDYTKYKNPGKELEKYMRNIIINASKVGELTKGYGNIEILINVTWAYMNSEKEGKLKDTDCLSCKFNEVVFPQIEEFENE